MCPVWSSSCVDELSDHVLIRSSLVQEGLSASSCVDELSDHVLIFSSSCIIASCHHMLMMPSCVDLASSYALDEYMSMMNVMWLTAAPSFSEIAHAHKTTPLLIAWLLLLSRHSNSSFRRLMKSAKKGESCRSPPLSASAHVAC